MLRNDEPRREDLTRARDQMGQLAWLLDDMFRIPGLNWRFGLDSVIGLIPGAGDLVTTGMGMLLLFRAFQFRLPGVIIARMIVNTLIDLLIGVVPFAGDLFDFAWKSNSMNLKLFQQYAREPQQNTTRHWIFLGLIAFFFLAVLFGVSAITYYSLRRYF